MFLREFGTAFDIGEEKSDGASGDRYTASNLNDLLWHKYSVLQMKFIETFWFPGLVDVQSPLEGEIPRSGTNSQPRAYESLLYRPKYLWMSQFVSPTEQLGMTIVPMKVAIPAKYRLMRIP